MKYAKLYSSFHCPFSLRAKLALCYGKKTFELTEIAFDNKPAAFLEISPDGTVPLLQLADGTVISESRDIVSWALPDHEDPWIAGFQSKLMPALKAPANNNEVFEELLAHGDNPQTIAMYLPFVKRAAHKGAELKEAQPGIIQWFEAVESDPLLAHAFIRLKIDHTVLVNEHIPSIKGRIEKKMEGKAKVLDESHLHGYCHGLESHFKLKLLSNDLKEMAPLERHRHIHEILKSEIPLIHSLSIES